MYIINEQISYIEENEISIENVFNKFYYSSSRLLYVKSKEKIVGIVSLSDLEKSVKNGIQINIVRNYKKIQLTEEVYKIEDIIKENNIKSAVPIINIEGKIIGEGFDNTDATNQELEKCKNKIEEIKKNIYLLEEYEAMKKLLERQKIIVIGKREDLFINCGDIFNSSENIEFIESFENPYEALKNNHSIIIDLKTSLYPVRADLMARFNCGYCPLSFYVFLINNIEKEKYTSAVKLLNFDYYEGFKDFLHKSYNKITNNLDLQIENNIIVKAIHEAGVETINVNTLNKQDFSIIEKNDVYKSINRMPIYQCFKGYEIEKQFEMLSGTIDNAVLNFVVGRDIPLNEREIKYFKNPDKFSEDEGAAFEFKAPGLRRFLEGDTLGFNDICEKSIHFENGIRKNIYAPTKYKSRIICIGACTFFGSYVDDEYTIPALIQKRINDLKLEYQVVNYGMSLISSIERLIKRLKIEKEDIIVILHPYYTDSFKLNNVIDISEFLGRDLDQLRFLDDYPHCTKYGSKLYADGICHYLVKELKELSGNTYRIYNRFQIYNKIKPDMEFQKRQNRIENEILATKWDEKLKVGSIVMNANPFTNGHKYLVEKAMEVVERLYVFVVEDERPEIEYKHRFEMVARGVEEYKDRVKVLPSGYIGSYETFPSYHNKEKNISRENISTIMDNIYFCEYLVPLGNITYRFVGTEENDNTTRQYNRDMKYVLGEYGINVVEIDRLQGNDKNEVRAGKVRNAYNEDNLESIIDIVPNSTYEYLKYLKEKNYLFRK